MNNDIETKINMDDGKYYDTKGNTLDKVVDAMKG